MRPEYLPVQLRRAFVKAVVSAVYPVNDYTRRPPFYTVIGNQLVRDIDVCMEVVDIFEATSDYMEIYGDEPLEQTPLQVAWSQVDTLFPTWLSDVERVRAPPPRSCLHLHLLDSLDLSHPGAQPRRDHHPVRAGSARVPARARRRRLQRALRRQWRQGA